MAAGPGGVTHRCTLLTQGVHPTLFMLGPLKLTPEVSGSSGPHCVEQVDFWGESLEGRERARQSSILCRCRKSSPPRGTNSIMAMGPAGGQYSPTPLRRNGFQLGGGVRQRTSHRKLALLRSGWDSRFGHNFPFGHRLLQTGLEQQAPAVCIPPGVFLFGGSFYWGGPLDIP